MITVYGEGRGVRVVWLLEEMGLPYRLRQVDLLADLSKDTEFLSVNPAGFIPAIVDGDVTMVESIAILEYLAARYGPTPLVPDPASPVYPFYLQFLHLGEAGLAGAIFFYLNAQMLPDPAQRQNPTAQHTLRQFHNRLTLLKRQLDRTPYVAGDRFTAADISVGYALQLAMWGAGVTLDDDLSAYLARITDRDGYRRAMLSCTHHAGWGASAAPR